MLPDQLQLNSSRRVMRKSEFAQLVGVTPGRVSQWISEGKITPDALDGSGYGSRIIVALALEQLKVRLHSGQRQGNGASTRLVAPPEPIPPQPTEPPDTPVWRPTESDDLDLRIKRERVWREEAQNRRLAEEEKLRAGLYVLTADHQAAVARVLRQTLTLLEADIPETANAIAAKFEIPQRDVLLMLRNRFNEARGRVAAQLATEAATLPDLVEEEPGA